MTFFIILEAFYKYIDINQDVPTATIIYRDGLDYNASPQITCAIEIELIIVSSIFFIYIYIFIYCWYIVAK